MKAAIFVGTLPAAVREVVIQQADTFSEFMPVKEKATGIVAARLDLRSLFDLDVDEPRERHHQRHFWEGARSSEGKGGEHCFRCGGLGHIAVKCGMLEPTVAPRKALEHVWIRVRRICGTSAECLKLPAARGASSSQSILVDPAQKSVRSGSGGTTQRRWRRLRQPTYAIQRRCSCSCQFKFH